MTINPEDDVQLDTRTTGTRDEIVARLLGWMKGPFLKTHVHMTEHGVSADQLESLPLQEKSVDDQLTALREAASQDALAAAEAGASQQELDKKHAAFDDVVALAAKARKFMADFDDEIARGEASAIRLDPSRTVAANVAHYTLSSVHDWAKVKYGISILGDESPVADTRVDNLPGGGWGATKAKGFALTLLLALERIAGTQTPNQFRKRKGELNQSALAAELAELAAKSEHVDSQGQDKETIRKRIAEALDIAKK